MVVGLALLSGCQSFRVLVSSDSSTCRRGCWTVGSGGGREFGKALGQGGLLDFFRQFRLLSQRPAGGILALTDEFTLELDPSALLVDGPDIQRHVEQGTFLVDAMVESSVKNFVFAPLNSYIP